VTFERYFHYDAPAGRPFPPQKRPLAAFPLHSQIPQHPSISLILYVSRTPTPWRVAHASVLPAGLGFLTFSSVLIPTGVAAQFAAAQWRDRGNTQTHRTDGRVARVTGPLVSDRSNDQTLAQTRIKMTRRGRLFPIPRRRCESIRSRCPDSVTNCSRAILWDAAPVFASPDSRACSSVFLSSWRVAHGEQIKSL
jgi:hypothetical protein